LRRHRSALSVDQMRRAPSVGRVRRRAASWPLPRNRPRTAHGRAQDQEAQALRSRLQPVGRFRIWGLEGDRAGRPSRLKPKHLESINRALRMPPGESGLSVHLWDGRTLAEFLQKKHGILLGVRQCQRLFHQLEFRLRKPRPLIARADPALQESHKKTPGSDERS